MASDHRGRPLHAGKRTMQENYGYHPDYRWGSGRYVSNKLDGATLHSPTSLPPDGWKFVNPPYVDINEGLSKPNPAWNKDAARRMVRTVTMGPDTAHISLSNDEYL
jgi:hypothetical protein